MYTHPVFTRYKVTPEGIVIGPRKEIKPVFNKESGYNQLTVYDSESKMTVKRYHRFILEAKLGRLIPVELQVNHKDGIKTNNTYSNLEVTTAQENTIHAYTNGLAKGRPGESNSMSKLTNIEATKLIEDIKYTDATNTDLGIKYGLHSRYVSLIRHKRRWKTLWDFIESAETKSLQV